MRRPHIRSQLCMWLKSNSLRNKEKPQNTNRYAEAEKAFQSEKIDMSLVKKVTGLFLILLFALFVFVVSMYVTG